MSKTFDEIVAEAHAALEYGTVSFTLKKAAGNVTTVDITRNTRRKVTGNAQALTIVGSMLKLLHEAGDTGQLTFTITMAKGESTELMTNNFNRKNLREGGYE